MSTKHSIQSDNVSSEIHITHGDEGINGRLMYSAKVDDAVKFAPTTGMVMQLTAAETVKTGVHPHLPAMFVMDSGSSPSKPDSVCSASERFKKLAARSDRLSLCVATRGYVMESSCFVDKNYEHGDLLTAIADDKNPELGGKLTNSGTGKSGLVKELKDPAVGVIIGQPSENHNQVKTIKFFTVWLPGSTDD